MANCKPDQAWLANDEEWNAIHDAQESYTARLGRDPGASPMIPTKYIRYHWFLLVTLIHLNNQYSNHTGSVPIRD